MKKLFVGKLAYKTTESELRSLFEPYGPVKSVKIITDMETGRSRGFGFVELEDDSRAAEAVEQLNGQNVGGFEIVVNEARESEGRRSGGSGGFGGGGNRFGGGSSNRGGSSSRSGGSGGRGSYGSSSRTGNGNSWR